MIEKPIANYNESQLRRIFSDEELSWCGETKDTPLMARVIGPKENRLLVCAVTGNVWQARWDGFQCWAPAINLMQESAELADRYWKCQSSNRKAPYTYFRGTLLLANVWAEAIPEAMIVPSRLASKMNTWAKRNITNRFIYQVPICLDGVAHDAAKTEHGKHVFIFDNKLVRKLFEKQIEKVEWDADEASGQNAFSRRRLVEFLYHDHQYPFSVYHQKYKVPNSCNAVDGWQEWIKEHYDMTMRQFVAQDDDGNWINVGAIVAFKMQFG